MQSENYDGSQTIERYDKELFEKKLVDPNVKKITIHKPGSIIQMSDRKYIVMPNGEWRRYRAE